MKLKDVQTEKLVIVTAKITESQKKFLEDNKIRITNVVKKAIDELIEEKNNEK